MKVIIDMIWCGVRYGASPSNYYNFSFNAIKGNCRKTFLTHRISQKLMRKYNSNGNINILYDKFLFAQHFKEYYGRECVLSKEINNDFLEKHSKERIIYKPLRGGRGRGIEVLLVDDNKQELTEYLRNKPEGIVESWINQHSIMSTLYPYSVNPIRVQTITRNGVTEIIGATLTIGNKAQFANASSHAIFALIDVDNGTVWTDGCDYDGKKYIKHPDTAVSIKGFVIPHWDRVYGLVTEATKLIPEIGYVGWDVAITENGAILIEGNNDPGYTAYQLPSLTGKNTGIYNDQLKTYLK